MAASNVPTFGNWESDGSVPYTVYFDKARKNKGRGQPTIVNPNDVQGINPYANRDTDPSRPPPPVAGPPRRRGANPDQEYPNSSGSIRSHPEHMNMLMHPFQREDRDNIHYARRPAAQEQFTSAPPTRNANVIRTIPSESIYGSNRQVPRPGRGSAPYDRSIDGSAPFNSSRDQDQQAARERRVLPQSPPPWEESQYGSARSTPSRAPPGRQRPAAPQRNEPSEERSGVTVPKFGAWNENDPKSAENFTGVFEVVRAERNAEPAAVRTATPNQQPSHQPQAPRPSSKKQMSGCFSWCKKKN